MFFLGKQTRDPHPSMLFCRLWLCRPSVPCARSTLGSTVSWWPSSPTCSGMMYVWHLLWGGVLAAPVSVHGPHQWGSAELPWEQRCYINLPYRFMENWQCWQGASLTGKTAVDQAWTTQLSHKVKQVNGFRLHLRNRGWKAGNRNKLLFFFSVIR